MYNIVVRVPIIVSLNIVFQRVSICHAGEPNDIRVISCAKCAEGHQAINMNL